VKSILGAPGFAVSVPSAPLGDAWYIALNMVYLGTVSSIRRDTATELRWALS